MMLRISHHSALPLVVTVACLWAVTSLGCADRSAPPQPSASAPVATIVSVEGASTTYHTRDWNGKRVTVRVPSQSAADIRGKDAEGTVRGTITAVDPAAHRVRVRTSEGQTIVLAMEPGALAGLKAGDRFVFNVPEAPRS
jgi:phage baseplate assembly protein gpV